METGNPWTELVDELLGAEPRLAVVKNYMKRLGLEPSNDLVDCMERALAAMEARAFDPEVTNEL